MAINFGAAAITAGFQQGVRCRNPNLSRTTCADWWRCYPSWRQIHSLNGNASMESELA